MSQPQVPQTATGGGWRNAFQNAQGQTVYSENTDGSVNLTGIYFPDGSYLTTASGTNITGSLSSTTIPMSNSNGALQDSPISLLPGAFLVATQPIIVSFFSPSVDLATALHGNLTCPVGAGDSAKTVNMIASACTITIPAGTTLDGVWGYESDFSIDPSSAGTLNEFIAYRIHSITSTGATLGTHIGFCGSTSAIPFNISKGVFISSNYQYGLDLNPTIANCLGTAPICHSTQGTRYAAPTILDGWYTGTGSPNTVVTANIGSIYSNRTGGANTTLYVKESGNGTNTGWVAK